MQKVLIGYIVSLFYIFASALAFGLSHPWDITTKLGASVGFFIASLQIIKSIQKQLLDNQTKRNQVDDE